MFYMALALSAALFVIASPSFAQHDHGGHQQPQAPMMPPREKMDMSDMMEKMSHIIEQNAEISRQMDEMMKAGMMASSKGMVNLFAMMQSTQALAKDMQNMMERLHEAMQDRAMLQEGKMKELMQGMQKHIKEMQKHTEGLTHGMEGVTTQLERKMPKWDKAEARPQSLQKVYGYEVLEAGCCETARSLLAAQEIDLVILDILLPNGSGIELLDEIVVTWRGLPVIINTAYDAFRFDFKTWGADAFVVKSSDLAELKSVVVQL
jgi:CheY-like chemotaxis protein